MMQPRVLQWNPDFLNPQFFQPHDFLNDGTFALDLLQSKTNFTPDFWNLDFSKLPIFGTNSCLAWKKFIKNLPSIS